MARKVVCLVNPRSSFLIDPASQPPLGLWYLSTALKQAGHEVILCDENLGDAIPEADVYGITGTTPQYEEIVRVSEQIRESYPAAYITLGGPHASLTAPSTYWHCNGIVRGEGEIVFPKMVNAKYPGLVDAPRIKELDRIPFPDRSQAGRYNYQVKGIPATTMITSRGCPHRCAFCSHSLWGRKVTMRTSGNVIRELKGLKWDGWDAVMFFDDTLALDPRRLAEISEGLGRLQMTWRCFMRAKQVTDKLAHIMKRNGCHEVGIGVESGSDEILTNIQKDETVSDQEQGIRILRKEGVLVKGFLIIGLPGETVKTLNETEDFLDRVKLDDYDFSLLSVMPGSPLFESPQGYDLKWEDAGGFYKGTPGDYRPSVSTTALTSAELLEARDRLEKKFKPALWEEKREMVACNASV